MDGYKGVSERSTSAQEAMRVAASNVTGVGDASMLLTAFLMSVISSTIGCKLLNFPGISCADGCSRVFLAKGF
jgi:hypothetical protein